MTYDNWTYVGQTETAGGVSQGWQCHPWGPPAVSIPSEN